MFIPNNIYGHFQFRKIKKAFLIIIAVLNMSISKIGLLFENTIKNSITGLIFSKDRPIQLNALLESFYLNCKDDIPLVVYYTCSNLYYCNSYKEIEMKYFNANIEFIEQKIFKIDLIKILGSIGTEFIFFLVDDIIFKTKFSFKDYLNLPNNYKYILSLRLGKNLNYCYTKQKTQKLPEFKSIDKFISWSWQKGEHDWNYVFSVDGNIYCTKDILAMTKLIPFNAPNSYEANMNIFRYILGRKKGLCYESSILVNLCINRVQNEIENIAGNISIQELNKYWSEGLKIDVEYFQNINNKSAHIEIDKIPIINRGTDV